MKGVENLNQILEGIVDYNLSVDEDEKVTFIYEGVEIHNPFFDSTHRFKVDPLEYYGRENIKTFIERYRDLK